ncbi:MAG: citrate synthase [Myxococcota bacterium]
MNIELSSSSASANDAEAQPRGLEGVVVAHTELSGVDGLHGKLTLRGLPVETWAQQTYEAAALRLLADPTVHEDQIRTARHAAFAHVVEHADLLNTENAMDALRALVACLGEDTGTSELIGAVGVFVSAWIRRQHGKELVAPQQSEHAADLLWMARGSAARPEEIRALNAYLCTVMDHGMNASTFAARVVASTESDRVSAVVAAIGALKGRLHGGAPGPVLDMLDAVETPTKAKNWIEAELVAGRRIMGMGHRVYRVRDPRARALEAAVRAIDPSDDNPRVQLARAVEAEAERQLAVRHPNRPLRANVEFYTAIVLEALQIPRTAFTSVFAAARVVGWCGHYDEQRRTGRLIRPRARYVGPEAAEPPPA